MVEPLSEQLAELSVRAKHAEDEASAARKEAKDKVEARREQARAIAREATEKVDQQVKSVKDTTRKNWDALRAKVTADVDALKANVAERKHDRDLKRSESDAEELEWEAGVAIDYAIASIEQAEVAVLDAIAGRVSVEQARES
jgi:hypothetical protein